MTLEEKVDQLRVQVEALKDQLSSLQKQIEPLTNFKVGAIAISWFIGAVIAVGTFVVGVFEAYKR